MILAEPLTFSLPGRPQGKGRARSFRRGAFIGHYTPEATRSYEGMIRDAAFREMDGREPTREPVEVLLTAVFDIPQSYSKRKRAAAICGSLKPAKKPDIDNIIKAFVDAINGVVFHDDCQIVRGVYAKVYGPAPMVVVTVKPLGATGPLLAPQTGPVNLREQPNTDESKSLSPNRAGRNAHGSAVRGTV